jgi:hypothetical protein
MGSPTRDIFEGVERVPQRRHGLAPLGQGVPRSPSERLPLLARVSLVRAVVTVVLVAPVGVVFAFPVWAAVGAPVAFVLVQCVRLDLVRWVGWSVLLAAVGAQATTIATFELRFVVLLAFVSPLVAFCGSVLRAI